MAHKVESQPVLKTRGAASRRYLYFEQPPEVWIADAQNEDHAMILKASGRRSPAVAGWMVASPTELKVDAGGSLTLQIPTKRPDTVTGYLRSLPGRSRQSIIDTRV